MHRRRTSESHVLRLSGSFPVVLVTGPRQSGKTTLLENLGRRESPPRRYVTLDDFDARRLALADPVLFFQTYPPPLTVDESQHAPNLLPRLKGIVDRSGRMGDYWLTGSPRSRDLGGIEALARLDPALGPGAVVCLAQGESPLSRSVRAIPVGCLG